MNPVALLRVAAAVATIQGLAHATLVWRSTPQHGPAEVAVVEAMKANHFTFTGVSRSYWDFYFGYAMMVAFTCLIEAMLFWQLSRFVGATPEVIRTVAGVFVLYNVGHALLAVRFFFAVPIVFDLLIVALLAAVVIAPM